MGLGLSHEPRFEKSLKNKFDRLKDGATYR
jgi:hypothetical protein